MHQKNLSELLMQSWYQRMGFSSNISLYYTGKIWDLDYDIKEFLNDNLWGVESLDEVEKFLHSLYKHDTDLNVVAIDNYTNQILVYLDPIGLKSLYVNDENLISSSIEELRNDNSELDYQYLGLVRKFGYNQNNLTPYKNIKRLLPGYMYKGNLNTFYFRTEYIKVNSMLNTGFMLPLYITESIRNRLNHIEDKVIWVLLSWGLDSSIVTSLLLKVNETLSKPKKFRFFTTENEEDLKYAKEVAKFLGIELEIIPWDDVELTESELYGINETPIDLGSTVPNIKLFKRISSMGIKTIITGDGPDELFRWYKRNAEDFDYHQHDILNELVYYHFPRLQKAAENFWINLITPYITHKIWTMALSFNVKIYKGDLKDFAHWLIPESVIERIKEPLKNKQIRENKVEYQHKFLNNFISYALNSWESTQTIKK